MEVLEFEVDAAAFDLSLVSDVQLGVPAFDAKLFQEYMDDTPESSYFLGIGDYVDGISPSNRALIMAAKEKGQLYDTVLDDLKYMATLRKEEFLAYVEHTAGRWLALLQGHHFFKFGEERDGTPITTDTEIAEALDTLWVPGDLIVEVTYGDGIKRRIHAWHGNGGAATAAGVYNKMRKKEWANADVYVMGHTHTKFAIPGAPRVDVIDPKSAAGWRQRETWFLNTGSYLRGYMRGRQTYVEAAGYPPSHLGGVRLRFDREGRTRVIL